MDTELLSLILQELREIHALLKVLPEYMAATHFVAEDERAAARLSGKSAKDIWIIPPPDQR